MAAISPKLVGNMTKKGTCRLQAVTRNLPTITKVPDDNIPPRHACHCTPSHPSRVIKLISHAAQRKLRRSLYTTASSNCASSMPGRRASLPRRNITMPTGAYRHAARRGPQHHATNNLAACTAREVNTHSGSRVIKLVSHAAQRKLCSSLVHNCFRKLSFIHTRPQSQLAAPEHHDAGRQRHTHSCSVAAGSC